MYNKLTIIPMPDGQITVRGPCIVSGEEVVLVCSEAGFQRWKTGTCIQDALPELSADEREFLISGIGPGRFDDFFTEESDDNS